MNNDLLILKAGVLGLAVVVSTLVALFVVDRVLTARRRRRGTQARKSIEGDAPAFASGRSIPAGTQQLHVTIRARTSDGVALRAGVAIQYRLRLQSRARIFYDPSQSATQITQFYAQRIEGEVRKVRFEDLKDGFKRILEATKRDFARTARLRGLEIHGAYLAYLAPLSPVSVAARGNQRASGLRIKGLGTDVVSEHRSSPEH